MAGLVWFVAGRQGVAKSDLAELGLAEVIGRRDLDKRPTEAGPGGQGCLLRPLRPDAEEPVLGCYAADAVPEGLAMEWTAAQGREGLWVGHYVASPPGPGDLERAEVVDGHWTLLADGHKWLVPIARASAGGTNLPQAMQLGPDGGWVRGEVTAHGAWSGRVGEFFDLMAELSRADKPLSYVPEEWMDVAVGALAVNYHVDAVGWAASHLKLVDTHAADRVLQAAIDMPTRLAVASEVQGNADAAPATDDGSSSRAGGAGG